MFNLKDIIGLRFRYKVVLIHFNLFLLTYCLEQNWTNFGIILENFMVPNAPLSLGCELHSLLLFSNTDKHRGNKMIVDSKIVKICFYHWLSL